MAKYLKASDDVVTLFNEVLDGTTIQKWVEFEVLNNEKQKELCKITKLNDLVGTLTDGLNFAVVINEKAFDKLPVDLQKIAFDECLAGVCVSETDVVSQSKGDFVTFTGVLQKYGHEPIITMKETIKSIFEQLKKEEDELKAATGVKRGRKKKTV